jgi:hypothetical protein
MIRLLLSSLVVVGCASTPSAGESTSETSALASADAGSVPVIAALYRGPCLGRCPEYQVEVSADGTVRFRGERNVAQPGESFGRVTAAQLEALDRLFTDAHFTAFAGRYEHLDTTDLPLVVIAWKGKVVRHAHGDSGAPPELTKLEDDLDALLGTAEWVTGPTK